MTRRANPYAVRLIHRHNWNTLYPPKKGKEQVEILKRDKNIREYLESLNLDICNLRTEHIKNMINIHVSVIDDSLIVGENNKIEKIINRLRKLIKESSIKFKININKVINPYTNAQCIANTISSRMEKREKSRSIIKDIKNKIWSERSVKGAKIILKGLIDGTDMTKTEKISLGKPSFSTIANNIEYGWKKTITSRGVIGVKVYLNFGKKTAYKNIN